MGWRFRRSLKIMPGVHLNISKRGVSSLSLGGRGATLNLGKRGVRQNSRNSRDGTLLDNPLQARRFASFARGGRSDNRAIGSRTGVEPIWHYAEIGKFIKNGSEGFRLSGRRRHIRLVAYPSRTFWLAGAGGSCNWVCSPVTQDARSGRGSSVSGARAR